MIHDHGSYSTGSGVRIPPKRPSFEERHFYGNWSVRGGPKKRFGDVLLSVLGGRKQGSM